MAETIIQTGTFTGSGANVTLTLRQEIDWMDVWCDTFGAANTYFYWQQGMGTSCIARTTAGVASTLAGSFNYFNTSVGNGVTTPIAIQSVADAVQPAFQAANTGGILTGNTGITIRTFVANWPQLNGLDLAVTPVTNTSFTLIPTLATTPGGVGGAGTWQQVLYPPSYRPTKSIICNISQAVNGLVSTLNYHGLAVGQSVRLVVPAVCGMTQLNYLSAIVMTVPTTTTFTVNIDTTAFTAFRFPTILQSPCTFAEAIPYGESLVTSFADSVTNLGSIGMTLTGGAGFPAGAANNIGWKAGRSISV
jgi:hypothetical protein